MSKLDDILSKYRLNLKKWGYFNSYDLTAAKEIANECKDNSLIVLGFYALLYPGKEVIAEYDLYNDYKNINSFSKEELIQLADKETIKKLNNIEDKTSLRVILHIHEGFTYADYHQGDWMSFYSVIEYFKNKK